MRIFKTKSVRWIACGATAIGLLTTHAAGAAFDREAETQGVETEDIGQRVRAAAAPARDRNPTQVRLSSEAIAAGLRAYLGGCDLRIDELKVSDDYRTENDSWMRCPTSLTPLRKTKFALSGNGTSLVYDLKPTSGIGKTRRYAPNDIQSENIGVAAKTASWMTKSKKVSGFCTNCAHFLISVNFESNGNEIKGFFPWPGNRKKDSPWDIAIDNLKLNIYASMKSTRLRNDGSGDSLLFHVTDVDLFADVKPVGGHGGDLLGKTTLMNDIFKKRLKQRLETAVKDGINNSAFARTFDQMLKDELLKGEDAVNALSAPFRSLGIPVVDLRFDEDRDGIILLAR